MEQDGEGVTTEEAKAGITSQLRVFISLFFFCAQQTRALVSSETDMCHCQMASALLCLALAGPLKPISDSILITIHPRMCERACIFNMAVTRNPGVQVPRSQKSPSLSSQARSRTSGVQNNNTPIWEAICSTVPHPLAALLRTFDVGVPNDICGFVFLVLRWLGRFVILHPLHPSIPRLVARRGPGAGMQPTSPEVGS